MNDAEIQKQIIHLQDELEKREVARADFIQDHIDAARDLVPTGTNVRQVAFEELLKAFEKLYSGLKMKGIL